MWRWLRALKEAGVRAPQPAEAHRLRAVSRARSNATSAAGGSAVLARPPRPRGGAGTVSPHLAERLGQTAVAHRNVTWRRSRGGESLGFPGLSWESVVAGSTPARLRASRWRIGYLPAENSPCPVRWLMYRSFANASRVAARDEGFVQILGAGLLLVAVGTITYTTSQHWSLVDGFYFAVATLTTSSIADRSSRSRARRSRSSPSSTSWSASASWSNSLDNSASPTSRYGANRRGESRQSRTHSRDVAEFPAALASRPAVGPHGPNSPP